MTDDRISRLRDASEDIRRARAVPDTPQTRSPSYRLAFNDADFLLRDEMRGVRLQLELSKAEIELTERGIVSTVVIFGSARIPDPARRDEAKVPGLAALADNYGLARAFARALGIVSTNPTLARAPAETVRTHARRIAPTTGYRLNLLAADYERERYSSGRVSPAETRGQRVRRPLRLSGCLTARPPSPVTAPRTAAPLTPP